MFSFTAEQEFGSIELLIALDANLTTFSSATPLFLSSIASALDVSPSQVRMQPFSLRTLSLSFVGRYMLTWLEVYAYLYFQNVV